MKSSILCALAVAFGFSLLFGFSTADAAVRVDLGPGALESAVTSECGGCTITYDFDKDKCLLTRHVKCSEKACVKIPGMDSQECQKEHESSQNNVGSAPGLGQAKVTKCDSDRCSGPTATCDISTLTPALKPAKPAEAAEGSASLTDGEGEVTALTYSVMWDGTAIHYEVTNGSTTGRNIFWFDTPINGDFLAPGETLVRSITALDQPLALFRPIEVENPDDDGRVVLDAVTFVVSAEAEPVPVQQALP